MIRSADLDLTNKDISNLTTPDALAAFFDRLGYPTAPRKQELPATYGFKPDTADAIRALELLAEDDYQDLRVLFVQLRAITAKARNEIARNLGKRTADHLLVITKDFSVLEFVLIDKETKQRGGPGGGPSVKLIPRVVAVDRKAPETVAQRIMRRLTWTGKDGLDQFDKLRSVFQAAHFAEKYFTNHALFSDHYLEHRLKDDPHWNGSPEAAYDKTKKLMENARSRWASKDEEVIRDELFAPVWKLLGFKAKVNKSSKQDHQSPDYELKGAGGKVATVAFTYQWDRWLDGADPQDENTPDENPGAAVVSALAQGDVSWAIVTNGKFWRLYSKDAHSRSTNFYEIDLEETLAASGETDPNEAFRYWWLFFRQEAFAVADDEEPRCWLDTIAQGSRDYAKRLGERLKDRVFLQIFPHLAQGFLHDRKKRLGKRGKPSEEELRDTYEATLTLLYRLLFLLYAEARDLLPVNETAYQEASLQQIKRKIADKAGGTNDAASENLKGFSDKETSFYDRLTKLCAAMDKGEPDLNVPCYNGGLFITKPEADSEDREHRIAAFLKEHKVPDRFLALAIDRLSRDEDEKTLGLVFIDYKSLEVRHLGSIYEGLLEFQLKIASENLGVKTEKKKEKFVSLSQVKTKGSRKKSLEAVVRKGEVYLSNDKAERKASGSYYTPDPIVEYIVEHTVGPVLQEKLDALKSDLDKASKTFRRHLENVRDNPGLGTGGLSPREFAASKTYAEHRDLVEKVFDMKVLDPAMGSGHFLVEAVDFLTDRILDFLNAWPNNPVRFMLDKTRRSIQEALNEQGITVDPGKLTDINLLKRHVLKRCIYGVDLNPMAVELAKVSLWLDAFTLGAPLSFLDHHLRCGNSLIGATFADLKRETEGQLFAIDDQPLFRAITRVLFINAMADATAAEVHKSKVEYDHAREELSGYRIVLDLLAADGFVGRPFKPSTLLKQASELDFATRRTLIESLDEQEELVVRRVETISSRPDLRFFHWEIEFPEAFFGFVGSDQRHVKHKNEIGSGSAGFDAIIGNPPYVQERRGHKELFQTLRCSPTMSEYCEKAMDIFNLFVIFAVRFTEMGGTLGMIVPAYWFDRDGASKVRAALAKSGRLALVVDFAGYAVFEEASGHHSSVVVTAPAACVPEVHRVPSTLYQSEIKGIINWIETCSVASEGRFVSGKFLCGEDKGLDLAVRLLGTEGDRLRGRHNLSQGMVLAPDRIDGAGVFVLTQAEFEALNLTKIEQKLFLPFYYPQEIQRYGSLPAATHKVLFAEKEQRAQIRDHHSRFMRIRNHLLAHESAMTSSNKPFGPHRTRKRLYFEGGFRVLGRRKVASPSFTLLTDTACVDENFCIARFEKRRSALVALAILNSRMASYLFRHLKSQGDQLQIDISVLQRLPIPIDSGLIAGIDQLVQARLDSHEESEHQGLESRIDEAVAKLFGVSGNDELRLLRHPS